MPCVWICIRFCLIFMTSEATHLHWSFLTRFYFRDGAAARPLLFQESTDIAISNGHRHFDSCVLSSDSWCMQWVLDIREWERTGAFLSISDTCKGNPRMWCIHPGSIVAEHGVVKPPQRRAFSYAPATLDLWLAARNAHFFHCTLLSMHQCYPKQQTTIKQSKAGNN